jgi:predicted N-acyltransferase
VTPLGAASAGTTCPACGIGAPAEAPFCPACGERLLGGVDERRVLTVLVAGLAEALRRVGRDDEADAAAEQATDRATIMGANALLRRLQWAGEPAGGGVGT